MSGKGRRCHRQLSGSLCAAQNGLWNVSEGALGAQLRGVGMNVFPEPIGGPVPLTNGSGVFSPALAEFVLGAINLAKSLDVDLRAVSVRENLPPYAGSDRSRISRSHLNVGRQQGSRNFHDVTARTAKSPEL